VRFVLTHERGSESPLIYSGRVETPERSLPIEVRVSVGAETADGLEAIAAMPEAAAEERAGLERVAAAMVRSAVRSALRQGRRPPRRIQRWRQA